VSLEGHLVYAQKLMLLRRAGDEPHRLGVEESYESEDKVPERALELRANPP
jgi:hypothetical protein